jgi:hypothetical protein
MAAIQPGELDFATAIAGLLPHQRDFLSRQERNVCYCGGIGSGKSVVLCLTAILNGLTDPGGFSMIGRLNMPALRESTEKIFKELATDEMGEWRPTDHRFVYYNGHETIFKHLDMTDPKTMGHIKSMNLSAAYIDEATEISEDIYRLTQSRVRRKTAPRLIVRLATNPAGHDWVWRNFFDPNRTGSLAKYNYGITASTFANTHLDKSYVDNMVATWPADWQDRYIHGNFSDFSDLVWKDFSDRTHVWDSRRDWPVFGNRPVPPDDWPVIVGIDIGSDVEHDPWAITFIAVSPDASLYQFDEIYGNNLLIAEIAEEFHAKMGNRGSRPSIAYDYSNRQCALELGEHDIHGEPAIKEVRPGLFKVAQYMHIDPRLQHPFSGGEGSPRFFVASHCVKTINDLSAYKYAKDRTGTTTEDPAHEHSHGPDAVRYAIHTFRPLPEKMKVQPNWQNAKLDETSRLYWRDVAKFEDRKERLEITQVRYRRSFSRMFKRPGAAMPR